jgi:hypothetical protein
MEKPKGGSTENYYLASVKLNPLQAKLLLFFKLNRVD